MQLTTIILLALIAFINACESGDEDAQAFQPILSGAGSDKNEGLNCVAPKRSGTIMLNNNIGLVKVCADYQTTESGNVEFSFHKEIVDAAADLRLSVPITEAGYVWDYDTAEVLRKFEGQRDACDMLLSNSLYPPISLTATNGAADKKLAISSIDCNSGYHFKVKLSALSVATKPGEAWLYEIDTTVTGKKLLEPLYIKGKFEIIR